MTVKLDFTLMEHLADRGKSYRDCERLLKIDNGTLRNHCKKKPDLHKKFVENGIINKTLNRWKHGKLKI